MATVYNISTGNVGATGQVLTSNGVGVEPTFQASNGGGGASGWTPSTGIVALTIPTNKVGIGTGSPNATLDINTANTAYDTTAKVMHITNTSSVGQVPLDFYINGTLRGRIRTDYAGNVSHIANGGSHSFYTGGDYPVGTSKLDITNSGNVGIGTNAPTAKLSVNGTANNTTGTWGVFSDERIKNVECDFVEGLDTILQINPKRFKYNGKEGIVDTINDQVGIIAQEVEKFAPYMISTIKGQEIEDLKQFSSQALPFVLVNAIKELNNQIKNLKVEIKKLKNK